MVDRREYVRFVLDLNARCGIFGAVAKGGECRVHDVSRKGMRIMFDHDTLDVYSFVNIDIDIPGKPDPVSALGEVQWAEKIDDRYNAGLSFTSVEPEKLGEILQYAHDMVIRNYRKREG